MRYLAGLLTLLMLGCGSSGPGPHVVLISIDTLRADHLPVYGYPRATTPHLDAFFADGTVFENATASAPCTIPSVRQFLAGAFDVDENRKVLAEYLLEHGYSTGAVVSQHSFHRSPEFYRPGFQHFDIQAADDVDAKGWTARDAPEVTRRGIEWLEAHAADDRIFLWLHYFDPHDPYNPPEPFRGFDAGNRSDKGNDPLDAIKASQPAMGLRHASQAVPPGLFDAEDWKHFRNLYDGEIQFTDEQIGLVLDRLDGLHLTEQAIVAVISDHGEWLGEENRWNHCATVKDAEVHVPFLLRVNGAGFQELSRVVAPVSTLDVLPTVLGLLGIPYPAADHHGVDLRTPPEDRVVATMWSDWLGVRNADWKLITQAGRATFLYQTRLDREERWNRLHDQAAVRRNLTERARSYLTLRDQIRAEKIEEQLRSIGYIQ